MFHVEHFENLKMNVAELTEQYVKLIASWNSKINLIHSSTLDRIFDRHITDSLQICDLMDKDDYIIDVGAGAGFPGVILAIHGYQHITLCEKSHKKCVFLMEIKNRLGLNFIVNNENIYNINVPRGTFSKFGIVSRAFGKLDKLLDIMTILGADYGVFHKGAKYLQEINMAKNKFSFDYVVRQSITDERGAILKIFNVKKNVICE
jgi:16S rRNA (guanine527-N7)-methyltransferase